MRLPCCILALFSTSIGIAKACTDILVTPGASADGSSMIAYNADSPTLYGVLYHYPASTGKEGTMLPVHDWDSGAYMGEIAQVNETYNVVGNSNEHGLIIGETTFGGVSPLAWNQTGAIMDYGSLIYIALQRCKTAQAAIITMVGLMDEYGYASGGESFSLTDRTGEVWMMEVISRGNDYQGGKKGAVWVAQRIPDGAVAAHANQARITTFPRNDPDNCWYADDVIDVAIHYGLFPADKDPAEFSFSDVYDPLSFLEARQGEARVWSIFSEIADDTGEFQRKYQNYATGKNLTQRMPLYITPKKKLTVSDIMDLMASHYEGTVMDSSTDVGSGLFSAPYRPRPLQWEYKGQKYHNERSIATAKTGWNFIGQVRPWMPPELSAVVWFACDDSSTAPRVPVYGSSRRLSPAYYGRGPQDGYVSPLLTLDMTKAFWVQNMVSNFAYYRWSDVYPVLKRKLKSVHEGFLQNVADVDNRAGKLYEEKGKEAAIKYVTLYSVNAGNTLHKMWMDFYGELFVTYRDFYTITAKEDDPLCACEAKEPGLSDIMKKRIVDETGDHYRVLEDGINKVNGVTVLGGENGPPKRKMQTMVLKTES